MRRIVVAVLLCLAACCQAIAGGQGKIAVGQEEIAVGQEEITAGQEEVVAAQDSRLRHAVRFMHETRLYRQGTDLYVVSLNLEWPQRLNSSELPALQRFLTGYLLGEESAGMLTGLRRYFGRLGSRLTAMPDDASLRRHYVELTAQVFWYEKNRYVSLYAYRQERDGEGRLLETKHRFFTYDLPGDRILTQQMLFNRNRMWGNYSDFRYPFEEQIVRHAVIGGADDYVDMSKLPGELALMGDAVLFELGGAPEHADYSNISIVKTVELTPLFDKAFKKYLEQDAPDDRTPRDYAEMASETVDGLPIVFPDTVPEFPGGTPALLKFLASNTKYPAYELSQKIEGRVVVSVVVNPDGSLSDLMVVNPVSPGLAREAARAFSDMPRWNVGIQKGQPVRVRVSVPVTFSYQSE